MSDDLVKRLRGEYRIPIRDGLGPVGGAEPDNPNWYVRHLETPPIQKEAADAIERITRERDEAREALKPFAAVVLPNSEWQAGWPDYAPLEAALGSGSTALTIGHCRRARVALEDKP